MFRVLIGSVVAVGRVIRNICVTFEGAQHLVPVALAVLTSTVWAGTLR